MNGTPTLDRNFGAQIAPPPPTKAIPAALQELERAQARVTGATSELLKRIQPVLRMEPANGNTGLPPQASTNCEVADRIVGEVNALDRAADAIASMTEHLAI